MKDIDWSNQPTPEHVWIEDLNPDSCGDFSGWYRLKGEKWMGGVRNGFWQRNADENGHVKIHRKPGPEYMPKVGEWCEVESDVRDVWVKAMYVGVDSIGSHVFDVDKRHLWRIDSIDKLVRPIKSDREVFIERALNIYNCGQHSEDMANSLYDNGARFTDD